MSDSSRHSSRSTSRSSRHSSSERDGHSSERRESERHISKRHKTSESKGSDVASISDEQKERKHRQHKDHRSHSSTSKRSDSKELVVSDPHRESRRVDRKLKKARTELSESEQESIIAEAEEMFDKVSVTDQDNLEEYLHMFNRLRELIRVYEALLMEKPNSRDVYALSTLYSQQREVIADIRTMSDLSAQAQMLQENMLSPFSRGVVQCFADMYYALRKLMIETVPKDNVQFALSHLDTIVKDMGRAVDANRIAAEEKIQEILLGPKDGFDTKPKRKHRR